MLVLYRSGSRGRSTQANLVGWVVGFGCSVLADQVFFLALAWAAVQLDVPELVGVVLAAGALPRLLVLLVSGAAADARSPKRIIIGTDTGRALVMAAAAAVLLLGDMNAFALVALAVIVGTLDGFFLPAVAAVPVQIAPPHLMGRVSALRTVTQRAGMLGGGSLAGWLLTTSGPTAAFGGAAALFALSVTSLALVKLTPPPPPTPGSAARPRAGGTSQCVAASQPVNPGRGRLLAQAWADVAGGFRLLRGRPVLAGLLVLIAGMNVGFAGPFTAGIPLLADARGWGASGAGLLIGAFGVGAGNQRPHPAAGQTAPSPRCGAAGRVAAMGVAIAVVGAAPLLWVALAAGVVLGLASGLFGTLAYTALLDLSPAGVVGQVMALLSLTLEGTAALSFLTTGLVATSSSADAAFLLGGLVIVATTLACSTRPYLRHLPTPHPTGAPRTSPAPHRPADRRTATRHAEPAPAAEGWEPVLRPRTKGR